MSTCDIALAGPRATKLSADLVEASSTVGEPFDVHSVDYWPKVDCDLTFILREPPSRKALAAILRHECVRSATASGRFVNIELDDSFGLLPLGNLAGNAERIAVEHTSMVPVFPLNVATFRSSFLGDSLARILRGAGADVSCRFWAQDSARQVDLLREAIHEGVRFSGKQDHALGAAFAQAMPADAAQERISATEAGRMFPLARQSSNRSYCDNIVKWFCEGWSETFAKHGIQIPNFDVDSEFTNHVDARELMKRVFEKNPHGRFAPRTVGKLSYLESNVSYYAFLIGQFDLVFSVVPQRQQDLVIEAARLAAESHPSARGRVVVVPYGQVLIDGKADSIRGRRFHSVDTALIGQSVAVRQVLGTRSHCDVHLSSDSLTHYSIDRPHQDGTKSSHEVQAAILEDEVASKIELLRKDGTVLRFQECAVRARSLLSRGLSKDRGALLPALASTHL